MLDKVGLYGKRVMIFNRSESDTNLPNYFANLIVSGKGAPAESEATMTEAKRLQRPCGGVLCTATAEGIATSARGPLPDSGKWTHQYADTENSICNTEARVRGELVRVEAVAVRAQHPESVGLTRTAG